MNTYTTFIIITTLIVLLPTLIGTFRWKKLSKAQQVTTYLLGFISINQLVANILSYIYHLPNLPLYHLYILVESVGLILIFKYRFQKHIPASYFHWFAGILGVFNLFNVFVLEHYMQMPVYSRTVESLVIIILAIYYFYVIMQEVKIKFIERSFWFWLSFGLLIYFTTNLFLFVFNLFIYEQGTEVFHSAYIIHSMLNIMLYILYSISLLCKDPIS